MDKEECAGLETEIKSPQKLEEALRSSEERFRIAAECSTDLIWEWDVVKGTLAWFGKIDEMLGYAPGSFPRTIEAWEQVIIRMTMTA